MAPKRKLVSSIIPLSDPRARLVLRLPDTISVEEADINLLLRGGRASILFYVDQGRQPLKEAMGKLRANSVDGEKHPGRLTDEEIRLLIRRTLRRLEIDVCDNVDLIELLFSTIKRKKLSLFELPPVAEVRLDQTGIPVYARTPPLSIEAGVLVASITEKPNAIASTGRESSAFCNSQMRGDRVQIGLHALAWRKERDGSTKGVIIPHDLFRSILDGLRQMQTRRSCPPADDVSAPYISTAQL